MNETSGYQLSDESKRDSSGYLDEKLNGTSQSTSVVKPENEGNEILSSESPKVPCLNKGDNRDDKGFGAFLTGLRKNFADTRGILWVLMLIFFTTFICYPALDEATTFSFLEGVAQELSWFILICATIFNIGDTIGRKMGGMPTFDLPNKLLIIFSLLRVIFIALFFFTAY